MNHQKYLLFLFCLLVFTGCIKFEDLNQNPNEPTQVSADVLLPGAIRSAVNTSVDASFLVGNNAAQLTAKTLRLEVDAYNWNAFPTYWEAWYENLTDIKYLESIAAESNNDALEATAIILRCWIFANLTNAYGNIPYSQAILGASDNFTPTYDEQEFIYEDMLAELKRADQLLATGTGTIEGDILLDGDALKWQKFGNSLRLRLLMTAQSKMDNADSQFATIVNTANIISSNEDNVSLQYISNFPNEFPLLNLKSGDFDAVAISQTSLALLSSTNDPRLLRYARPNNEDYTDDPTFIGAINGQGSDCNKEGASRLGAQYFNYPGLTNAASLGLPMAEGMIISYAEVEFLLAEAAAKGWIANNPETHYKNAIAASMNYHQVDFVPWGWNNFEDFYANAGITYNNIMDIWQQKWLALFFNGLEPYFELRRWYHENGNTFEGIPFIDATCNNINGDRLPLKFLYPTQEQSLNAANYQKAIDAQGGTNDQNAKMWLVD